MKTFFVNALLWVSRRAGSWVVRLVAWFISSGYFLFRPDRVKAGLQLYKALFPERGRVYHLYCTWRQFHEFAASFADRIDLDLGGRLHHGSIGLDHLREAARSGEGAIVLTSHLGNWEIGARLFKEEDLPMTLLMGERDSGATSRVQKEDLRREGLNINVSASEDSPFSGLEVLRVLRNGELLAIAGDVAFSRQRQKVTVNFLGRQVELPSAPHVMALISGAPIISVFAYRQGRGRHFFEARPPRYVQTSSRTKRDAAIKESAQIYAHELEQALRRHPWQWAVFEPFLGPPAGNHVTGQGNQ